MQRAIALITGACGGMGRACARTLGRHFDLALTDIEDERLQALADALREEGFKIASLTAGDLSQSPVAERTVSAARSAGHIGTVVHTAGLSPALAGWEAITLTNVLGTEKLLRSLEAALESNLVAILLASMAGHLAERNEALDRVLEQPLRVDLLAQVRPYFQQLAGAEDSAALAASAYAQSKRAVIRMCERRAAAWGAKHARILSLSPGTTWTPMGRREAESNPAAAAVLQATPLGRWGSPIDIANAVEFFSSDLAGFITGCDVRIDGGVTPALGGVRF